MVLRAYMRSGLVTPARFTWVVVDLMRRLTPRKPEVTTSIDSGLRLQIDPRTAIGRDIYFSGSCEPLLVRLLERILTPGMVVVDAGANIGEITVRAARLVGHRGRVFAMEASPVAIKGLRYNVELNHLTNVKICQLAVGDRDAVTDFLLGEGRASGSSSLFRPHDFTGETVPVELVRFDTFLAREHPGAVDLVKLDVEGAELAALKGASKMLSGHTPPIVIFEYNHNVAQRAGWTLKEILNLLTSLHYSLYLVCREGLRPLSTDLETSLDHSSSFKADFAAFPPARSVTAYELNRSSLYRPIAMSRGLFDRPK